MNTRKILLLLISTILFSNFAFTQVDFNVGEPKRSLNVHGMRISDENETFEIVSTEKKIIDNKMQIDFLFNQGVDKNTVNGTTVKINNTPASMQDTTFIFSKDAKTMRIILPLYSGTNTVTLESIKSFSGNILGKTDINF